MRRRRGCGSNSNAKKSPDPKKHYDKTVDKNDSSVNVSADSENSPDNPNDTFEAELQWCIEKLNLLLSSTKNISQKQSEVKRKALNILNDPKALMVKKRSVMRISLGDYRAQMKAEEQRYLKESENMTVISVASENHKGIYIKKRKDCTTKESDSNFSFRFNFTLRESQAE